MTHPSKIRVLLTLFAVLAALNASAQWRQLPIPSVHGRLGIGPDGALRVLTNGTLCLSDSSKQNWTYHPFPYDLNKQDFGLTFMDPPNQVVVATADTLVFVSSSGYEYYFVRGEESIHSSMEGLRSQRLFNSIPYLFSSRGSSGELLLCHGDLYRSTNSGASWELKHKHPKPGSGFALGAVDERNSGIIFLYEALGATYIYKSVDDGATWRLVYNNDWPYDAYDMLLSPDSQIIAGEFHSQNYGETWSKYAMEPGALVFSSDNKRFVYSEREHGIFALNHWNGLYFRDLGDPTFRVTSLASSAFVEPDRRGVDLACDPVSGSLYTIITDSLYEYHERTFKALTGRIFAAGITTLNVYDRAGDTLLITTPSTLLRSTDGGQTWPISRPFTVGAGWTRQVMTVSKANDSLIYWYYLRSAYIWTIQNDKMLNKKIWDGTSCPLTYDPHSSGTFYGGSTYVWRMTDSLVLQADSNAILYAERFTKTPPIGDLRRIAFDERRKGVMLLGGVDYPNEYPFLYRTNNLGVQWERVITIPLKLAPVDIFFDPVDSNRILVLDPTGVYISTDDGASWEYRDPGLDGKRATCIAHDPDNPKDMFLGVASPSRTEPIPVSREDGGGVWRSTDGGYTWRKLPIDGLFNYNISHLHVLKNPLRVLVGTPCGAYEYRVDSTTSIGDRGLEKDPSIRFLHYPNPCGGSVTIEYVLEAPSSVRIVVYDLLGRSVASSMFTMNASGVHRHQFNTSVLLEGMYTLAIQTGNVVSTRSMIVNR